LYAVIGSEMTELKRQTITEFFAALSSGSPTPGGGCVAALSGGLAAALGCMVCEIAKRKGEEQKLHELSEQFTTLRDNLLHLADKDAEAFSAVMAAYRLPKSNPGRGEAIDEALSGAAAVPLQVAATCVDLLGMLIEMAPRSTSQSVSDVGVAAYLAGAAVESALLNVTINLAYMKDQSRKDLLVRRRDELRAEGRELSEKAVKAVELRVS